MVETDIFEYIKSEAGIQYVSADRLILKSHKFLILIEYLKQKKYFLSCLTFTVILLISKKGNFSGQLFSLIFYIISRILSEYLIEKTFSSKFQMCSKVSKKIIKMTLTKNVSGSSEVKYEVEVS